MDGRAAYFTSLVIASQSQSVKFESTFWNNCSSYLFPLPPKWRLRVRKELLISQEECGGRQRKERAPKSQLKFLIIKSKLFFTRPLSGVESISGSSVYLFVCLSSLLILQTLTSFNRYLSNGRSNPKNSKDKVHFFFEFCFWEDPPHPVNWSPNTNFMKWHCANGPGWTLWQANYLLSMAFKGW